MKTYKLLLPGLLVVLLTACESFLDVEPTDRYTQKDFWQTSTDAQAALTGVYNNLTSTYMYGNSAIYFEAISSNAYNYSNVNSFGLIARGAHDANATIVTNRWSLCYTGIGRANQLLTHIDDITMNENTRNQYKGEASFLRALYYFDLWSLYGGVPLILEAPDAATQGDLPRDNAADVFDQIIADLDFAAANLPVVPSEKGRATKGAALSLKARAMLYAGLWDEAAAAAQEVIDLNTYSLFGDYRGLFYLENEGNGEIIFDIQFKFPEFSHGFDIHMDGFNNIAPLQDLVDDYYMTDGLSIEDSPLFDSDNPFDNRDPRLLATIMYPGSMYKGTVVTTSSYPQTGYGFKKYTIYKDELVPTSTKSDGQSEINFILLRYADVLLTYAEAQNEDVGPDGSVYDAMNLVRQRAGMPELTPGLTQDEMRDEIRHERRIELAAEGHYYFDILRWGTAETVMNGEVYGYANKLVETRSFNPARDYVWPIPSMAIQKNGNLDQNPNYGE